jgi:hypothetical protein
VEADFTACEDFFCSGIIKVVSVICVFLLVACYQPSFILIRVDGQSILDISS